MRIGITGGIATGKSRVTQLLRERGSFTFSADEAARAELGHNSTTLQQVVNRFGTEILQDDNSLNRKKLGEIIFQDGRARSDLERITHPGIARLLRAQITAVESDYPDTSVFVEVPLLFEAKLENFFEIIVVVAASEEVQRHRLVNRDGIASEDASRRIKAQMPISSKVSLADYVVRNDTTENDLRKNVDFLFSWIMEKESQVVRRISIRQVY